jgi:predicted DNA-binding transcriptional regulator AlpA
MSLDWANLPPRLNTVQAAEFLGFSKATLDCDVSTRQYDFPFRKLGQRRVYLTSELQAWLDTNMEARKSTRKT